ncbi:MAG TPA: M48 family metalloprotease [Dongiaceae bacterium]|jgi:predicted Zn-dependent protease|nr:M48 family metalloprotease [Dongiaceae bacterium]
MDVINGGNQTLSGIRTSARRALGLGMAAVLALAPAIEADAQSGGVRLIRDAEIEATLRAYADPIFAAAGLDTSAVQVHIIEDKRINAFVSNGMQIFIHTGLLTQAKTPNELIGVIAHETGHIQGGHLARRKEELENRTIEAIIGLLAGVAVGVASGNGAAGVGAATLGQSIAQRDLLQYSQAQEGAADQAAFRLLEATQQSPKGMVDFFRMLVRQEALSEINQDPYMRTHPLTTSRVDAAEAALQKSPYANRTDPPELMMRHERMLAKLNGYLEPLSRVMTMYPEKDQSVPARYARAIAYFRVSRTEEALASMDSLLKEAPNDPFFIEQKAQILYDRGRIAEALPLYQRALDLAPQEPLIRLELAEAQVELEDPATLEPALENLKEVVRLEPKNARAFHLLATAYGRSGDQPMATLAQAEEFLARGKNKEAKEFADRALQGLKVGSPGWLKAQDIQFAADQNDEDE